MSSWRAVPETSAILMVDVQERLLAGMSGREALERDLTLMLRVAKELSVPVYVTEQVPEKLGATVAAFGDYIEAGKINSKAAFSAAGAVGNGEEVRDWVLCGMETHICVRQTAFDLREQGKRVRVLADAVISRGLTDHRMALEEMRSSGIQVTTVQALIYEWLETSLHEHFKNITTWVKENDRSK